MKGRPGRSIYEHHSGPLSSFYSCRLRSYTPNAFAWRRFLSSDTENAKTDLLAAIEAMPSFSQNWVKIASVYMELGDGPLAFEAFDKAAEHDPKDSDIYYHKGQGMSLRLLNLRIVNSGAMLQSISS